MKKFLMAVVAAALAMGAVAEEAFTIESSEEDAESLVRHRNRAGLTSDERNDTMSSKKSFKEVGKALRAEQTVNKPTERNTRLRPQGLGRQASSTRQSSGEQSTGQATASLARLQLTTEAYVNIPGEKAVHVVAAKVTYLEGGVVSVETPWGVTYTTHLANVVLVKRKNPVPPPAKGQRKN